MTDEEKKMMWDQRFELATDSIDHARICIQQYRGDMALKALDIAELQLSKLKDLI